MKRAQEKGTLSQRVVRTMGVWTGEEDDVVAFVRVYCGLSSTQQGDAPTAVTSAPAWLTLAVVDDSGRLLDVFDITDDPSGYAVLGAVLAQRSGGWGDVAVAADEADHLVTRLLAAAGRPLAIADEDALDDYADRFGDDSSPEELAAPVAERRTIGLARALQAGALAASVHPAPRQLVALKPVLAAQAAVASGRQCAAVALREVLRELYPAALRAYPDPCEPVPLAVLDALPEAGLLVSGRDASVMAELTAARVGDPDQIGEAITALRVAIAETPRRAGIGMATTSAIAETIRQSVAAVRACDSAVGALVGLLTERAVPAPSGRERAAGPAPASPVAGHAAAPRPVAVNPVAASPLAARPTPAPPPAAPVPAGPASRESTRSAPRGGRAASVTPMRPLRGPGGSLAANGADIRAPAAANGGTGNGTSHASHASNGATGEANGTRSRGQGYPNDKLPGPRPSPEATAPGSRADWPLANSGAFEEVTTRQPVSGPAGAAPGNGAAAHGNGLGGHGNGVAAHGNGASPAPSTSATSYGPLDMPSTVLDTGRGTPQARPGRVPPPWQDDALLAEPPALHLVEPVPLANLDPLAPEDATTRLPAASHSAPADDPLGGGYPPPLRLVAPGVTEDGSDSDLLIFAAAKSAWFIGDVEAESTLEWANPADAGWEAAERAANQPVFGDETSAGLPRRVPQANLVPGSALPPANSGPDLRILRDPAAMAAHTTGYFRGSRRGEEVRGFAVGGRPGRESANGWDFTRDGWESDREDEGYRSAAQR